MTDIYGYATAAPLYRAAGWMQVIPLPEGRKTPPPAGFTGRSRKPVTEDYVPLVPWLGVMWWGVASGQWLLHEKRALLARCVPMAAPLSWLVVARLTHAITRDREHPGA